MKNDCEATHCEGYGTPTQPPHTTLSFRTGSPFRPTTHEIDPTHMHHPHPPSSHTHTHTHTLAWDDTELFHRRRQVLTASTNHILVLQRARPLLLWHISIPLCFPYISNASPSDHAPFPRSRNHRCTTGDGKYYQDASHRSPRGCRSVLNPVRIVQHTHACIFCKEK